MFAVSVPDPLAIQRIRIRISHSAGVDATAQRTQGAEQENT
ncbi:MAG TPA: hypothetical protein VFS67_25260 [Polyangiaceae bacterium]|nr:hypothetical protein [Polyangiaceae bacterium]